MLEIELGINNTTGRCHVEPAFLGHKFQLTNFFSPVSHAWRDFGAIERLMGYEMPFVWGQKVQNRLLLGKNSKNKGKNRYVVLPKPFSCRMPKKLYKTSSNISSITNNDL